MLKQEFTYYIEHQTELVKKYNGRIIVIVGNEVVGDYKTKADAYFASIEDYKPNTFLIQECSPGEDGYTITERSRTLVTS